MEEVFPRLSQLPEQPRAHLQKMIDLLELGNLHDNLPGFRDYEHIFKVLDTDGKLRCLLKVFCEDDEQLARNEACAYLLDHPEDDHRSRSPQIYGFSGVLPSVFVRFKKGNEKMIGVLVEFVEPKGKFIDYGHDEIEVDEIHKLVVADIRFGNMDRNEDNVLVREGENGSFQLVPIDHESSFANVVQAYNICSPCWIRWLSREIGIANKAFSLRSVSYVARLDPDSDLEFLRHCGWEPDDDYKEKFKVFATFLKKSVSQGLSAVHIGLIASYKCEEPKFNLQDMIEGVTKDEKFFESVNIRIEERLREYYEKM